MKKHIQKYGKSYAPLIEYEYSFFNSLNLFFKIGYVFNAIIKSIHTYKVYYKLNTNKNNPIENIFVTEKLYLLNEYGINDIYNNNSSIITIEKIKTKCEIYPSKLIIKESASKLLSFFSHFDLYDLYISLKIQRYEFIDLSLIRISNNSVLVSSDYFSPFVRILFNNYKHLDKKHILSTKISEKSFEYKYNINSEIFLSNSIENDFIKYFPLINYKIYKTKNNLFSTGDKNHEYDLIFFLQYYTLNSAFHSRLNYFCINISVINRLKYNYKINIRLHPNCSFIERLIFTFLYSNLLNHQTFESVCGNSRFSISINSTANFRYSQITGRSNHMLFNFKKNQK